MDEIDIPIEHKSKPYLMIPFPDNATNGEVIKALFNCHVQQDSIVTTATLDRHTEFSTKWWNAPYKKREGEDKE